MNKKPMQWLLSAILTTMSFSLFAQVLLSPLVSTENIYGGASMTNNTGNDVCQLAGPPPNNLVNVMVYENGTNVLLTHQFTTSSLPGTTITLGAGLPAGTVFSDPDVVSVVSSSPGIGNIKERLLVVFVAQTPTSTFQRIYLEMYEWTGATFALLGGPYDLSITSGFHPCNTPNIDADFLGNYAIVWEEGSHVYMTSSNALSTWPTAPTSIIDHSANCGLLGDEKEPDVCIIPTGRYSLINVTFRRNSELYLERVRTNQMLPGLNPYPTSNCVTPLFYMHNFFPDIISDIRVACPPSTSNVPPQRDMFDLTMAFTLYSGSSVNIVTGTHHLFSNPPVGTFNFNVLNVNGSTPSASGARYENRKPAIAYKNSPKEFVVAWEFTDKATSTNNTYSPININSNLVAVRCDDANNPQNAQMSLVNNVTNGANTADAVSISKGDITQMQYGFIKDFNATRYNSTFPGANLKKEPSNKSWFIDYTYSAKEIPDFITTNSEIKMYPNPVAFNGGDIHLDLNNTTVSEISIMTIDGKQVYHVDIENQSTVTIPNQFPKGAYFVVIKSNDTQETKKLMIQ